MNTSGDPRSSNKKPIKNSPEIDSGTTNKDNIDQIFTDVVTEIQKTNENLQLMIRGLHSEIKELKDEIESISKTVDDYIQKDIKRSIDSRIKDISTGLDLLTNIPTHLRRTFEMIYTQGGKKGLSAKEVADRTQKSRSLESDYLNQLVDLGYILKEKDGKSVFFFYDFSDQEEDENGVSQSNILSDVNGAKTTVSSVKKNNN
ncbi:winged helix-turn-helix domain-containing protein [Candidatus Hodarchaeum mangrovi]